MPHQSAAKLFADASIPKNGNSPNVAIDIFDADDQPVNLVGTTGSILFYTLFELAQDAASSQKDIVLCPADDSKKITHLIKTDTPDTIVIGTSDDTIHSVASVTDVTNIVTMVSNLTVGYLKGEIASVLWKTATITSSEIVLGFKSPGSTVLGTVKNRISFQLADTETDRVLPIHRVLFKPKDTSGNETAYPIPPSTYILNIFDDVNRTSVA